MQTTRERILSILKERHQATVYELSLELDLTAVTVRHHLDILRGEGLIAAPRVRRRKSPGRPQYVYQLTQEASAVFPKRYDHLAGLMLDELHARLSAAEVDHIMKRIGERVADQAGLPDGGDFETRLAAVAEFLDDLGYMARWERQDDGDCLLHIANCPYEEVASQDHAVCAMDAALLTRLLGTPPERISCVVQGEPRCTYVIHPPGASR
jgi:predicted ArsR family transcriptional regulator